MAEGGRGERPSALQLLCHMLLLRVSCAAPRALPSPLPYPTHTPCRLAEEELAGYSDAVKKALSTRTGNVAAVMAFRKAELLRKFSPRPFDTGSSRVQIAMLTERISRLSMHLGSNKKDKHCKRSLTALTVRRRRLLEYMMRKDFQNYRLVVRELSLRPLPVLQSKYLPKEREMSHKQVNERNRRLKNKKSRGHKGH